MLEMNQNDTYSFFSSLEDRSPSSCSSSRDSSMSVASTTNKSLNNPSTDPILKSVAQLQADIVKMKRRTKHILDVSDQYMVDVDASSQENSIEDRSGRDETKSVRMTVESCMQHLKVLMKSYTKKHSRKRHSI